VKVQGPSAAAAVLPRSPLRLPEITPSRLPLTVLFRPQVQTNRFVCLLELSTWVIVLTIVVLLIILGAIALWDAFR